jgi:hypothetical protein
LFNKHHSILLVAWSIFETNFYCLGLLKNQRYYFPTSGALASEAIEEQTSTDEFRKCLEDLAVFFRSLFPACIATSDRQIERKQLCQRIGYPGQVCHRIA